MATSGDHHLATSGDFFMATDKLNTTISDWQEPMILAIGIGLSNARSGGYNRIVKHVGRIAFGFSLDFSRQWVSLSLGSENR